MKINSVEITQYSVGNLYCSCEGITHIKSLPYLSIVQATEGYYDIGIDSTSAVSLKPDGGTFIAPTYKTQRITHHINPETSMMRAHWIFLNVIINHQYNLEDCFDFPLELPAEYQTFFQNTLDHIDNSQNICKTMSLIYEIVEMLLSIGIEKTVQHGFALDIRNYVRLHYSERLNAQIIANSFNLSVSTLFREFKSKIGLTPANYINKERLAQASVLLETTDLSIMQIALNIGMYDQPYFSKLFQKEYKVSPSTYRNLSKKS